MAEIITTTSTVVNTSRFVFLHRYTFQKLWKHMMIHYSFAKAQILVLGRSGVGKSVLTSVVLGEVGDHNWKEPGISQDVEIKPITLTNLTKVITVVPGQSVNERRVALDRHFYKNELEGLIYVADWGFTDLRSSYIEQTLVDAGEDSLEKIRAYHLKAELDDFKSIIESLKTIRSNNKGPKWLLVAVTKFDLFSDNESEARTYYEDENSEFYSIIKGLFSAVGEHNIKVKICFVSSKLDNFEWNGTTFKPQLTSDLIRRQKFNEFVKELTEISK
jgi:hypothetical protein